MKVINMNVSCLQFANFDWFLDWRSFTEFMFLKFSPIRDISISIKTLDPMSTCLLAGPLLCFFFLQNCSQCPQNLKKPGLADLESTQSGRISEHLYWSDFRNSVKDGFREGLPAVLWARLRIYVVWRSVFY